MSDHNEENRREMGRRASDDVLYLLAPHILNDENVQNKILKQLEKIESTQTEMMEMFTIFKNTKGFFTTVKGLGIVAIWIGSAIGAIAAIKYGLHDWLTK